MPDIVYALQHPIQEFKLAVIERRSKAEKDDVVVKPNALKYRRYYRRQMVARRIVGYGCDEYQFGYDNTILSEDDRGDLLAPMRNPVGWWEPFNPWKLRHVRAALRSRRVGFVNFGEFE